jgi:hypothetical protein
MPIAVRYGVSAEIFQRYPSYRRGVVIAHGLDNGPATPELLTQLRASEQQIRSALDPSAIADHPGSQLGAMLSGLSAPSRPTSGRPSKRWHAAPLEAMSCLRSARSSISARSPRFRI